MPHERLARQVLLVNPTAIKATQKSSKA